jgi:hypothetical protein
LANQWATPFIRLSRYASYSDGVIFTFRSPKIQFCQPRPLSLPQPPIQPPGLSDFIGVGFCRKKIVSEHWG